MTATLTLDDKAATQLAAGARLAGESVEERAIRLLTSALDSPAQPTHPERFVVKPHSLNLPPEWTSGSVQELTELVEGQSIW